MNTAKSAALTAEEVKAKFERDTLDIPIQSQLNNAKSEIKRLIGVIEELNRVIDSMENMAAFDSAMLAKAGTAIFRSHDG